MNILAIDPGTLCGFATLDNDGQIESGVVSFRGDTPEEDCYGARFNAFAIWLYEKDGDVHPDLVVFEDQHFRGKPATMLGVGYQTRLMSWAYVLDVRLMAVHSGTLKLFCTGNGRAGKAAMREAAFDLMGRVTVDDNEADALCLLYYAMEKVKEGTNGTEQNV